MTRPLREPFTVVPPPKDPQRGELRDRYAEAMHKALRDYGEGETDPGTGSDYGDQTAVALAVRDEEMARLRAELDACRERYAVSANNAMQEIAAREAELVAARSTIDRVRAWADTELSYPDRPALLWTIDHPAQPTEGATS